MWWLALLPLILFHPKVIGHLATIVIRIAWRFVVLHLHSRALQTRGLLVCGKQLKSGQQIYALPPRARDLSKVKARSVALLPLFFFVDGLDLKARVMLLMASPTTTNNNNNNNRPPPLGLAVDIDLHIGGMKIVAFAALRFLWKTAKPFLSKILARVGLEGLMAASNTGKKSKTSGLRRRLQDRDGKKGKKNPVSFYVDASRLKVDVTQVSLRHFPPGVVKGVMQEDGLLLGKRKDGTVKKMPVVKKKKPSSRVPPELTMVMDLLHQAQVTNVALETSFTLTVDEETVDLSSFSSSNHHHDKMDPPAKDMDEAHTVSVCMKSKLGDFDITSTKYIPPITRTFGGAERSGRLTLHSRPPTVLDDKEEESMTTDVAMLMENLSLEMSAHTTLPCSSNTPTSTPSKPLKMAITSWFLQTTIAPPSGPDMTMTTTTNPSKRPPPLPTLISLVECTTAPQFVAEDGQERQEEGIMVDVPIAQLKLLSGAVAPVCAALVKKLCPVGDGDTGGGSCSSSSSSSASTQSSASSSQSPTPTPTPMPTSPRNAQPIRKVKLCNAPRLLPAAVSAHVGCSIRIIPEENAATSDANLYHQNNGASSNGNPKLNHVNARPDLLFSTSADVDVVHTTAKESNSGDESAHSEDEEEVVRTSQHAGENTESATGAVSPSEAVYKDAEGTEATACPEIIQTIRAKIRHASVRHYCGSEEQKHRAPLQVHKTRLVLNRCMSPWNDTPGGRGGGAGSMTTTSAAPLQFEVKRESVSFDIGSMEILMHLGAVLPALQMVQMGKQMESAMKLAKTSMKPSKPTPPTNRPQNGIPEGGNNYKLKKTPLQKIDIRVGLFKFQCFDRTETLPSPDPELVIHPCQVMGFTKQLSASVLCDNRLEHPTMDVVMQSTVAVFAVTVVPPPLKLISVSKNQMVDMPPAKPVTLTTSITVASISARIEGNKVGADLHGDVVVVREFSCALHERQLPLVQASPMEMAFQSVVVMETRRLDMGVTLVPLPGEEKPNVAKIKIMSRTPVNMNWCSVLQVNAMTALKSVQSTVKHYESLLQAGKKKKGSSSGKQAHVSIEPDEEVRVHLKVGSDTRVRVLCNGLHLHLVDLPGRAKPDVVLQCKRFLMYCNGFTPAVADITDLSFADNFSYASEETVEAYNDKMLAGGADEDILASDRTNQPLVEVVDVKVGRILGQVSPDLHFGKVIDDLSLVAKMFKEALVQGRVVKRLPRRYQLMVITASVGRGDFSILENRVSPPRSVLRRRSSGGGSGRSRGPTLQRLRLFLRGLKATVRRRTPPSYNTARLNEMDSDPNIREYGANNGGEVDISMDHVVALADPLTLAAPLAVFGKLRWKGILLIAPLSPATPCLGAGKDIFVALSSFTGGPEVVSGLKLHSDGLSPKVYLDGSLRVNEVVGSFGWEVLETLPKLMAAIERIQPPQVPLPPGTKKLGWWDNLRLFIHGNVRICVESLSYRWLLDSVELPQRSILLQTSKCEINYSLGRIKTKLRMLVLSVPRLAHPLVWHLSQDYDDDATLQRHALALIPRLTLDLCLGWSVARSDEASAHEHHSINLHYPSTPPEHAQDKFYRFRSHGVKLGAEVTVSGDSSFASWVALRVDVLPWLTHRKHNSDQLLPEEYVVMKDTPKVSPEMDMPIPPSIDSLHFTVAITGLRVAAWYGPNETNGVCVIIPAVDLQRKAAGEKAFTQLKLQTPHAVLLDIQSNDIPRVAVGRGSKEGVESTNTRFCSKAIEEHDKLAGILGASTEERVRLLKRRRVVSNAAFGNESHSAIRGTDLFASLQRWSKDVSDKRYLVEADSVFLVDRSIGVLDGRDKNDMKEKDAVSEDMESANSDQLDQVETNGSSISSDIHGSMHGSPLTSPSRGRSLRVLKRTESTLQHTVMSKEDESREAWTMLVSGMKLLWTIEIREAVMMLVGDFTSTVNFMTLQIKKHMEQITASPPSEISESPVDDERKSEDGNPSGTPQINGTSNVVENVVPEEPPDAGKSRPKSSLFHLLEQTSSSSGGDPTYLPAQSDRAFSANNWGDWKAREAFAPSISIPILEVLLSNPQIQLHSEATGGSIILAVNGVYIEGREFLKLYADYSAGEDRASFVDVPSRGSGPKFCRKKEYRYKLDQMEAFAVNAEEDVKEGLDWLELVPSVTNTVDSFENAAMSIRARRKNRDPRGPAIIEKIDPSMDTLGSILNYHLPQQFDPPIRLRKIINRCTFRTRQFMFSTPLNMSDGDLRALLEKGQVIKVGVKSGVGLVADSVEVQIDELSFILDSYQFHTSLDLIRHVILAPSPLPRQTSAEEWPDLLDPSKTSAEGNKFSDHAFTSSSRGTDDDDDESMESLSADAVDLESGEDVKAESQFTPEEMLEHRVEQWHSSRKGKRMRNALRQAARDYVLHLQNRRVVVSQVRHIDWILSKASWKVHIPEFLDDVEIDLTGLHGQHRFASDGSTTSQIELEDVRVNSLRPAPDSMCFSDPSAVVAASFGRDSTPCQRCGCAFDRRKNGMSSCRFHGDVYGQLCKYSGIMRKWPCCGAEDKNARGCVLRPHTGRERVITARVEAFPRSVKGVTLYKHVEVNIYPEFPHTLVVQMTKSVSKLFVAYFIGDSAALNSAAHADLESTSKAMVVSIDDQSVDTKAIDAILGSKKRFVSGAVRKKLRYLGKSSDSGSQDTPAERDFIRASRSAPVKLDLGGPPSQGGPDEVVFIKRWRVGNIDANISLAGFAIEAMGYAIQVPPFESVFKIGTGQYLTRKYAGYLVQKVLRSVAASSFSKVRGRIIGQGGEKIPEIAEERESPRESPLSEVDAERRTLILGGSNFKQSLPKPKIKLYQGKVKKKNSDSSEPIT